MEFKFFDNRVNERDGLHNLNSITYRAGRCNREYEADELVLFRYF